jgi:2-polyprenyl-3-methyl-5-hydroxy-6-metoxy-1,4-benzoquinol methylase
MDPQTRVGERDIAGYERAYRESGFEVTQADFRKRMLLELMHRLRPARVLEIGCGSDTLANHWTASSRFVVVEPAAGFAAEARRDTAGRADVTVIEDTLEGAVASLTADFDLILVSSLLHELSDCGPLLVAVRRLCAPDTVVHANVPNANSFHRLLALEMGLIGEVTETSDLQKALQQPRAFTLETLTALADSQGFSVFERGSYFVKPFTHGQMLELQEQGFLTGRMLDGLWGMARHLPDMGSEIFVNLRPAG